MRRTQLYLDEQLWNALHTRARGQKTTISELVRQAIRERYLGPQDEKRRAMLAFIGSRKNASAAGAATESKDAVEYVRALRRGDRLERLHNASRLPRG